MTKEATEVEIKIVLPLQAHELLKRLVPMGLYGSTVEGVAERLLCEHLRGFVQAKR